MVSPLFERVPPLYYGGTERVVYNLCRGLTRAGIDVTLFASGDSRADGHLVPVIDEALRLKKVPVSDCNPYHLKMLAQVARRAHEFDVIHNHHDYWMLPLTEMVETPLLTTVHGRMDLPDIPAVFLSYSQCSYVSISQAQRRPMPQLPWVRTIYHGINANDFVYHPNPGRYLAFLGRMSPEKRPEWAIEIAKKSGIPLKMAAKIEGPESQAHYDQVVKPHVDGKFIQFVGEISESEKSEFLGNALALVFPIDWPEPFGLVVVEALACGTPVLARPQGAIPEILRDGITGYIDESIEVLAKRVQDLDQISRQDCRDWVEKKFSLERMTEDYIHVYRHLTSHRIKPYRHRRNFLYPVQRTVNGNT